jgi:hypothetical protein
VRQVACRNAVFGTTRGTGSNHLCKMAIGPGPSTGGSAGRAGKA